MTAGEDPPLPTRRWGKGAWLHLLTLLLGQGTPWLTPPGCAQSTNLHSLTPTSMPTVVSCVPPSSQAGYALGILALSPCLGDALPLRLGRL